MSKINASHFIEFVGFMVFQACFTGFCPVPMILKMLGVRTGSVFE